MIQSAFINLYHEYNQEFHYYPFAVKVDRCVGSYHTVNDLSNKVCVPKEPKNLTISGLGFLNQPQLGRTNHPHPLSKI